MLSVDHGNDSPEIRHKARRLPAKKIIAFPYN
jgi:hypothetical protein